MQRLVFRYKNINLSPFSFSVKQLSPHNYIAMFPLYHYLPLFIHSNKSISVSKFRVSIPYKLAVNNTGNELAITICLYHSTLFISYTSIMTAWLPLHISKHHLIIKDPERCKADLCLGLSLSMVVVIQYGS